ncbi:MAG TPA: chemotaxis protein CheA [Polyangia bacterium]|nr:chemotaxis protein CheA [Polyangia bacterium]
MNFDQVMPTFVAECREVVQEMEDGLLSIPTTQDLPETIDAIFRAAHTLKGSAGLFDITQIVSFTHVVETVLDEVRNTRLPMSDGLVALLLSCCDHIKALVEGVAAGRLEPDEALAQSGAPLTLQLQRYADSVGTPATQASEIWRDSAAGPPGDAPDPEGDRWHISLRFGRNLLRNGLDPISFLRYLGTLGAVTGMVTLHDASGLVEEMDPESCFLGFEIAFKSSADKATIESAFDFVRDDCRIAILPPRSRISEYVRLIQELPEETARLGEILTRCGSVTAHELEVALHAQSGAVPGQRIGTILIQQGVVQPTVVDAAIARQTQLKESRTQEAGSIRVDAHKLDRLINLVGELIIAAARADLVGRRTANAELQECTSVLSGLVQEVRDSALQLRMVKIAATFNRFQRVVHDVSRELGKDIGLVVAGEETELDKTVVEKISDPLMHLVRNAIDHGIEPAELRAARGKPAKGTVRLNAYHDSGSIVIEVGDDGGGLKRDKILAKAVERGLVEPGRTLADRDIYALIFEPGFSTADQVTNLSGRGVGMDVVKRNITALRGHVDVASEEGVGTTVTVRMPLTLAIINGFLVGLGSSVFVIPLDMIDECVEFTAEARHDYTNLRGQVLPFIRLRDVFEVGARSARRESIVVVNCAGRRTGLVVDTLLGEFQTVIKPLAKVFNQVKCIAGSTILGNGEVALILDVPALVEQRRLAAREPMPSRSSKPARQAAPTT